MLTTCQNSWIIISISFIQGHSIHQFIPKIKHNKPNIQLRPQQHKRYSCIKKSCASLAQATGSRLGETVIREPCEARGFSLKRAATRPGEHVPRPKERLPRLSYAYSTNLKPPLVLAQASLDGVSLKRKLSAWARARERVWVCLCKSRLGESVRSRHCSSWNSHISTFKQWCQPYHTFIATYKLGNHESQAR